MLLYTNRTEFHSIIENKDYPQIPYYLINFFLIYFYYVAIIVVVVPTTQLVLSMTIHLKILKLDH